MASLGSHCDNTSGTKWTTTNVSDCKVVGLRATVKKSQERSPDWHREGVSKAGVLSSGTKNKKGSLDRHRKTVSKLDVPSRGGICATFF